MPKPKDPALDTVCNQCGKTFHTTRQRLRGAHQFCCRKCYEAYRRENNYDTPPPTKKARPESTVIYICDNCGKSFERKRYGRRPVKGAFCSPECYWHWRSEHLSGENAPGWKGGYTLPYGGRYWKQQRRLARERDNFTCRDCGKTEQSPGRNLDVHHIKAYDLFETPEEANQLDNLITLCRECHTKRHKQERE
jgi:hypothetical protein